MELSSYLIYFSISFLASISLGPSVIFAASNGVNFGRRKALTGVLGHISSILVLAIISVSGLGVILLASEFAFSIIKTLGALYLVYIGIAIWRNQGTWSFNLKHQQSPQKRQLFKRSFILGLSNPKALVFFSALFPQFINPESAVLPQFVILMIISLSNAFIFTSAYVLIAFRFKEHFTSTMSKRWIGKTTGSLFIGFAGMLFVS